MKKCKLVNQVVHTRKFSSTRPRKVPRQRQVVCNCSVEELQKILRYAVAPLGSDRHSAVAEEGVQGAAPGVRASRTKVPNFGGTPEIF